MSVMLAKAPSAPMCGVVVDGVGGVVDRERVERANRHVEDDHTSTCKPAAGRPPTLEEIIDKEAVGQHILDDNAAGGLTQTTVGRTCPT